MRLSLATILALGLTVGCGEKDDDDDDDDGTGGGGFTPAEGTWNLDEGTLIEDNCGLGDIEDTGSGGSTATLVANGDGTFTMTDDQDASYLCTLSGMSFTCETMTLSNEDLSGSGFDAVILVTATASGTFSSETEFTGQQAVEVACSGADCATVSEMIGVTLPCTMVIAVGGSYAGE